jgi:uncharacterized coiled-coil DUF342 family protein
VDTESNKNLTDLSREQLISYTKQLEERVNECNRVIDELNQKINIMSLDVTAYNKIIDELNNSNPDNLSNFEYSKTKEVDSDEISEYKKTIDELNQKIEIMNLDVIAYHNVIKGLNEINPETLVKSKSIISRDEEIENLTKELNEYKEALRNKEDSGNTSDSQELLVLKTELLQYKQLYEKFNLLHPDVLE